MTCPACGAHNEEEASACLACSEPLPRRGSIKPGFLLASRYEILTTLGQGGMGVVYKAQDRTLGEIVAIKVLRPDAAASPEMARRFLTEIRLARAVTHRNVCRIHEYGEDRGLHYISMTFVDGVDLKHLLRERGALPAEEAYDVSLQVAEGLQAIHDEGIIHRDLKTPNLMMDPRGVVRLMDFGIAKQGDADNAAPVTGLGQIIGTPEYMSPEQVRGEKLDTRSDIYALGIVIYELLTGETPFRGATTVAMLMRQLQEAPSFATEAAARIPAALVPVLQKALAKNRDERYGTAREMAEAVRRARGDQPQPVTGAMTAPIRTATARQLHPRTSPAPTSVPVPTAVSRPTAPNATLTLRSSRRPDGAAAQTQVQEPAASRSHVVAYGLLAGAAVISVGGLVFLWMGRQPADTPAVASYPSPGPAVTGPPGSVPQPSPPSSAETRKEGGPSTERPSTEPRISEPASPQTKAGPTPRPTALPRPGSSKDPALAAQVEGLLAEAQGAFAARDYAMAIGFYDEALKLDSLNTRAKVGKDVASKALSQPSGKAFVVSQTSTEARSPATTGPRGFEEGTGGATRKLVQQTASPGKITFAVEPDGVKGGDAYSVKVFFVNEGEAVARFKDVSVVTTVNGNRVSGSVAPLVPQAAPHERALIVAAGDHWKTETASWSMAVTVRTENGDVYRNEVRWQ